MKPEGPPDPSKETMGPEFARAAPPAVTPRNADRDELDWIGRARGGDRAAFARLVERHHDRAYTLALRIVRVPAEAEEVAQDAFVRVWRALPGFRGDAAFSTWLHRIVVRRSLDRLALLRHRQGRETPLESAPEPVDPADTVSDLETRARRVQVERMMATLSAAQRTVVTLYYLADRSVDEVAAVLGMPPNTVKTHLARARAAMRAVWDEAETR
ncbi:MAG: RNA polymerase sigma factor [Candidatus Eisenbacteria bacterium]